MPNPKSKGRGNNSSDRLARIESTLKALTQVFAEWGERDIVVLVKEREKGRDALMKELKAVRRLLEPKP